MAQGNWGPGLMGGVGAAKGNSVMEEAGEGCYPQLHSLPPRESVTFQTHGGGKPCLLLLQLCLPWSVSCLQETLTQYNRTLFSHIKKEIGSWGLTQVRLNPGAQCHQEPLALCLSPLPPCVVCSQVLGRVISSQLTSLFLAFPAK